MTGFQSKRQASKDLLQQLLDALELDALEHPGTINNQIGWADKARELCDALSAALFDRGAAVAEPLKDWEFVAMWATAAEIHADKYSVAIEFGRAVESRHGIGIKGTP